MIKEKSIVKTLSNKGSTHIALFAGGMSKEREVSLESGKFIGDGLINMGYRVTHVDMGLDFCEVLKNIKPDIVFNSLHGTYGEDGCLPGILNILRIPYTHSGLLASSIAFNKVKAKKFFDSSSILSPESIVINKYKLPLKEPMKRPYVIKPISQGSSIGVKVILENDNFQFSDYKFEYGDNILLEKYIKGIELQVAILGQKALGVMEIKPLKRRFYDYDTKYNDGLASHIYPANISKKIHDEVVHKAELAAKTIGTRGISRAEFIYSSELDKLYMLEINTHPGFTKLSICPEIANYYGLDFESLLKKILDEACYDNE